MKLKESSFFLLLLVVSSNAYSQSYLSLDSALRTARENNINSSISALDEKIAHANLRQTDAVFLPQIELGYTAVTTNNPLNAFGFLLNQASVTSADFNPERLNSPGAVQNYGTKAEMRLPLLNLDMIYMRKSAKSLQKVYKYKSARTEQYIDFEVKKAYTILQYAYKAKEILERSLSDIKNIYQTTENFQKQGIIQESDVLNALVQVNTIESALAKANSSIYNASEGLSLLMGLKEDDRIYTTSSLLFTTQAIPEEKRLSLKRADIAAMSNTIESVEMMEKSALMAFFPKINAFGTYQLNDSKAFGFNADSYMAGISLSWTLFSGNQNKGKYKSYKYQKHKLEKERELLIQQSHLELNKSYRELKDLQLDVRKQTSSVKQAEEVLRILKNRYMQGLSNTTDMLAAQGQLSQQELLLSQAIMSYHITSAYIHFLSEE